MPYPAEDEENPYYPLPLYRPPPPDEYVHVGYCPTAKRDITLCYNVFGRAHWRREDRTSHNVYLLIMGLGCPGCFWDSRMCEYMASKGNVIIRYDNRDVGLSTHMDDEAEDEQRKNNAGRKRLPNPSNILRTSLALLQSKAGRVGAAVPLPEFVKGTLQYTLRDLARDAFELLRRLDFIDVDPAERISEVNKSDYTGRKVNIIGCSMGGMIAQHFALDYGCCINSLCLHSTCAYIALPQVRHTYTVVKALMDKPKLAQPSVVFPPAATGEGATPKTPKKHLTMSEEQYTEMYKEDVINYKVRFFNAVRGDLPFPEDEFRLSMRWTVDRCVYEGGVERQLLCIVSDPDRTPLLRHAFNRDGGDLGNGHNHFPVLVLHGGADVLLDPSGADHLACNCFHKAKLLIIPRMGHYYPPCTFVTIADSMMLNGKEGSDLFCHRYRKQTEK